jgi:hypothetical protein
MVGAIIIYFGFDVVIFAMKNSTIKDQWLLMVQKK